MDWFSNNFQHMMRSDYIEPKTPQNLFEVETAGTLKRPFYEMISEVDCYIGLVDGYAYRSNDRLRRMRKRGCLKPVGPLEMYAYPCCTSMDMGWWINDPYLKNQTWYLPNVYCPQTVSEKTKFVEHQLKMFKVFPF